MSSYAESLADFRNKTTHPRSRRHHYAIEGYRAGVEHDPDAPGVVLDASQLPVVGLMWAIVSSRLRRPDPD